MDKIKKVKKKRKMVKNLTLPHWDLNPEFLNKTFPPKIWILREITSIELIVLKKSRLCLGFQNGIFGDCIELHYCWFDFEARNSCGIFLQSSREDVWKDWYWNISWRLITRYLLTQLRLLTWIVAQTLQQILYIHIFVL